jgi:phosphate acetyltransferase
VIVAGDRVDIILASIVSFYAPHHANISGIILSGDIDLSDKVLSILEDLDNSVVPIWRVKYDSFQTVKLIDKIKVKITIEDSKKIILAKGMFDKAVDRERLSKQFLNISDNRVVTPIMFEYKIFEQAQSNKQRIILPESSDERILRATEILLNRDIVDIILLGDKSDIEHRTSQLGIDVSKATIINPKSSKMLVKFSKEFYNMRKDKGLSKKMACDTMDLVSYFATMMIHNGLADGMVSGAIHTTADTVRPALQIIKTKPNIDIVSSLFFMCLDTEVLIYADCAINQNPNSKELASIAISSANSAKEFGLDARVAMLSYSTGDSGDGEDVQKVREATKIVKELRPDLIVDGPMQYDTAIDKDVAKQKLPNSEVGGRATVFIFPDLNTGNNTYKAVQRSTGALAIGPILQGLKKPINDLSRGCNVDDIVNTVAITAIQAQKRSIKL